MKQPLHPLWILIHPRATPEWLGYLPGWLDLHDPRGAAEQLDSHYQCGGFRANPFKGFKVGRHYVLKYPGDPDLIPIAMALFRGETVCLYEAEIVAVFQEDGSFVAARFD